MILVRLCVLSVSFVAAAQPAIAEQHSRLLPPVWRLEYDNDIFFNSDNSFTSGLSIQRHSRATPEWSQIELPRWMTLGRTLPGMDYPDLHRRVGLAIGQNIQTPDDLQATELIVDDVPYAGALAFELNWLAFDDNRMRAYALIVGVIGPLSGAEAVQKWVHRAIDAPAPRGWHNQLPNEPAANFNGAFKKKFARLGSRSEWYADVALHGGFGVGTALTFAEAAVETRFGFNVPEGFAFIPDPVGRGIAYDATYPIDSSLSAYFSFTYRQTYLQHFVFTDGSLWQDTHSVDTERLQAQIIVGVHLTRPRWGIHLSFWDASANPGSPFEKGGNDFGTVALDWRF